MNRRADELGSRRAALLQRGERERQEMRDHLKPIETAVDGVDRGLDLVRRVATRPVLLAGGVVATLLLGRGRTKRAIAAGVALLGVFLRVRSTGQMLAKLADGQSSPGQPVRRSR